MLASTEKVYQILGSITDPEVPVLTILDLGIVRNVEIQPNNALQITITPTYSGCPAMQFIATQIKMALLSHGYTHVSVLTILHPAWTTDWMTEQGKQKLKAYGIAPPQYSVSQNPYNTKPVPCPHCNSQHTSIISAFGSTSCKSLYKCLDCLEPFDYFKCY